MSYVLDKVIFEKKLNVDLGVKLIDYFWNAKNCNSYRKDYCIFSISQYFFENDIFFKLKDKFYNHIQKIYSRINESVLINSEEKSAFIYYINSQIKNSNIIKSEKTNKFAICISGLYRNHQNSLKSIIENIAKPLNADVYVHTWDKNAIWSGFGGSPIAHRIFEKEISECIPKDIYFNLNNLEKFMPNTYDLIKNPMFIDLDLNEIKSILKPKDILVENQDSVFSKIKSEANFTQLRGSLNQIKMFYGIKKSIDLALKNDNYDYIIRLRPDILISKKINTSSFINLENNTIYTSFGDYGLGDAEFIISSSMAYNLSNFINNMFIYEKLSLYTQFPLYDSHNLLLLWMVENNYKYSPSLNSRHLLKSDLSKYHIDDIEGAILKDFSNMSTEDKSRFESFCFYLQKSINL